MKHFYSKLAAVSLSALVLTISASALSHTVVRGDTMWKLAVKYQVGVSEIIKANSHIANPDLIYPGQMLRIAVPENATPEWYVVREGDTLYSIANKFNTTVEKLAQLNDIANPDLIYPRKRLRIRP